MLKVHTSMYAEALACTQPLPK